jgi:hypothetical protein
MTKLEILIAEVKRAGICEDGSWLISGEDVIRLAIEIGFTRKEAIQFIETYGEENEPTSTKD